MEFKTKFGSKKEKAIAKEVLKDFENWTRQEVVMILEDHEIEDRIKDYLVDMELDMDDADEMENYDDAYDSISRIIYRVLEMKEKKNRRSCVFGSEFPIYKIYDGYMMTTLRSDENYFRALGDFRKYYDEEADSLIMKCPFRLRDGEVVEVSPQSILIQKGPNFFLEYPQHDISFTKSEIIHEMLEKERAC